MPLLLTFSLIYLYTYINAMQVFLAFLLTVAHFENPVTPHIENLYIWIEVKLNADDFEVTNVQTKRKSIDFWKMHRFF